MRLGEAVAASACVPALFDPIEFNGLFPDRRLRLVDGGVHDNQGTAGLLEEECSVVLVSDASGQMNSESAPSGNVLKVLMRSNSISMARVRESEFRELETMRRSSALTGLMFLHLKKDLEIQHVDWVACQDPYAASQNHTSLTSYGIPKTVQSLLAGLRTDLDTFSDAEAYALMLSGYRMTTTGFKSNLPDFPVTETSREPWRFLEIEPTIDRASGFESDQDRLRQILRVGRKLTLKSFRLRPVASAVAALVPLLLAVVAAIAVVIALPDAGEIKRWSWIAGCIVAAILVILAILAFRQQRTHSVFIIGALLVAGGSLIARMQLWIFDPIFRSAGKVRPKR